MSSPQADNTVFLADEDATLDFGRRLARATFKTPDPAPSAAQPQPGEGYPCVGGMIYLEGDLGAGKTTLTRGILRGFGHQGAVKSPTYTLVEPYEFRLCNIYHFDLYRLADPDEVAYLGTEDYFANNNQGPDNSGVNNLCIVEWPERGGRAIPGPDLRITLTTQGAGRELNCQSLTESGAEIAKRLWSAGRNP
jgi:tRNA threonylcarbamoyladenosine biosynthesis protein TsaE